MQVDLRSDTVTRPTPEMKEHMFSAEIGDDVFEEDPSVNLLQDYVADLFGLDTALFCPSGTMCNQIAIRLHTQVQDEVICDKRSHIYLYEAGGVAANSLVSVRLVDGDRGRIRPDQILSSINPDNKHFPVSSLVSLENTVNKGGGSIYTLEQIKEISRVCREHNLKLHIDGARLFNALVETGDDPGEYGQYVDSVSVCLSKGLGAPVGSVIIMKNDVLKKAHRVRKVMGGGMRQAGYLAAAGMYALKNHVNRLKDDHLKARAIGSKLASMSGIEEVMPVDTNIIIFKPDPSWMNPQQLLDKLTETGIRAVPFGSEYIRFVLHLDITNEMQDYVLHSLGQLESVSAGN